MADVQATIDKWKRNSLAAAPTIKAGVMAVRESPTAKAADRADLYLQRVQEAVASGKFQAALRAVSLSDWQQATVEKGSRNLAAGVNGATQKMQTFHAQFQPYTEMVKRQIATMPKGSEADADNRVLATIRLMRQFKYQRRSAG